MKTKTGGKKPVITYFHRHSKAGFSINKVSQTYIREIGKELNIKQFFVPCHRADPISCIRNVLFTFLHRNKNGVNHITGDIHYCILGLIGCKSVLTIHDTCTIEYNQNKIKKKLMTIIWYKIPLLLASKIVCISEKTKNELLKITVRNDMEVIYNSIDPLFQPVQKEFNREKPVILHIGTGWNKNLTNVALALRHISCCLRIIGKLSSEQKDFLEKNSINYSEKYDLTDCEIIEEYINCDIVSFCSIFEGFGMPIIEANAVGRAVLTSKIEPMTEVAGDSALLVDPKNMNDIKDGFLSIIQDDSLRNKIVQNGYKNIRRFNLKDITNEYIELYNILLRQS